MVEVPVFGIVVFSNMFCCFPEPGKEYPAGETGGNRRATILWVEYDCFTIAFK